MKEGKVKTNKLTIYLIKEDINSTEKILTDFNKLKCEQINNVGKFYYGESHTFQPSWINNFFGKEFDNNSNQEKLKLYNASSKSVLLIEIDGRIFALTFGYGHTLLIPGVCEERFGLKVALGIVNSENLRSIDKKNMSVVPKLLKEQMTKYGTISDFAVDIEQDLIQGITGKAKDKYFGNNVTGKDAISLSVKINI